MACEVDSGKFGTIYTVPEDNSWRPFTRTKRIARTFPKLEAWWTNSDKGDSFLIRQENTEERADVLELSQGQLYDLLDALNRAIGLPGPKVGDFDCT
jgi:hypothetical protein